MYRQFQFFGFDPDDALEKKAIHCLNRLIDLSPYGSVPVALLEKTEEGFRCAIDLYTQHGPLIAQSCKDTANHALQKAVEAISEKLSRWNKNQAMQPQCLETDRVGLTTK